jgi:hypothetical protein
MHNKNKIIPMLKHSLPLPFSFHLPALDSISHPSSHRSTPSWLFLPGVLSCVVDMLFILLFLFSPTIPLCPSPPSPSPSLSALPVDGLVLCCLVLSCASLPCSCLCLVQLLLERCNFTFLEHRTVQLLLERAKCQTGRQEHKTRRLRLKTKTKTTATERARLEREGWKKY